MNDNPSYKHCKEEIYLLRKRIEEYEWLIQQVNENHRKLFSILRRAARTLNEVEKIQLLDYKHTISEKFKYAFTSVMMRKDFDRYSLKGLSREAWKKFNSYKKS